MRKILFVLFINLMFTGVTIGGRVAQADPVCGNNLIEVGEECDDGNTADGDGCSSSCQKESPELSVNLRMEFEIGNGAYELDDFAFCDPAVDPPTYNNCITPNITVANVSGSAIYVSKRAFNEALFHRYIRFIDPDFNEINNNQVGDIAAERQELAQEIINGKPSETVMLLDSTYIQNSRLPSSFADFDGLDRTGRWEAVFELGVRTFLEEDVFRHITPEFPNGRLFAHSEDLDSKIEYVARAIYHVVGDEDVDGYSYSLASALLTQMNDPDVDCDDTDPNINPGMTEISGNGIDDDCDASTLDIVSLCNFGKPKELTMVYTGEDCSNMFHQQGDNVSCEGFPPTSNRVYIVVNDKNTWDHKQANNFFTGFVNIYDNISIPDRTNEMEIDVSAVRGGLSNLRGNVIVHVFNGVDINGDDTVPVAGVDIPMQKVVFHTSCSVPLFQNDQFGSIQVLDGVGEDEPE